MRLIDADDFKKFMQALCKAGAPYGYVVDLLDTQPTAYDVDKVVEELELHSFELGTDTLPVHYVRLNEAIEIVKQGGIRKDV